MRPRPTDHDSLTDYLVQTGALRSARVIEAFRRVRRGAFVPAHELAAAYEDHPLPIGWAQTISQPTIVAIMTEALALTGREKVLEIGTGSGWQAAILSLLAREVFSIERIDPLALRAAETLLQEGYRVHVRAGDGYLGWPEEAPFDRILVTAAPPSVPERLLAQLAEGGMFVAPIGDDPDEQDLLMLVKRNGALERRSLGAVRFVPMLHGATAPWT